MLVIQVTMAVLNEHQHHEKKYLENYLNQIETIIIITIIIGQIVKMHQIIVIHTMDIHQEMQVVIL